MTRHTVDTINSDQLDALYDELERLRAGEEPGWDPAIVPTPGQWIARWNRATPEERLGTAKRVIDNADRASNCFLMAHEKRLDEQRHAWVAVARVRDVIADMEQITGARHWARILRKAIDEGQPATGPAATQATVPNETREAEAIRQMDDDPHGLKAGMVVRPYREYGQEKWVFRCWGTDDGCDGLLSLDHSSQQGAERARDRHVAEDHKEQRDA